MTEPTSSGRPQRRIRRWVAAAALIAAIAVAAPWLAPFDPDDQPDPAGAGLRPPLSTLVEVALVDGRTFVADRVEPVPEGLRIERLGTMTLVPTDALDPEKPPTRRLHLLGTDRFGRDVLSRVLVGGRVSLRVATTALAISLFVGLVVGMLAGTAGPFVDGLLMRGVDGVLAFPRLFLLLALVAVFHGSEVFVVAALGLTSWMGLARLVRGEVQALRGRDFVLAARAAGAGPLRVALRHLLPNAAVPVVVDTSLRLGDLILLEAALSFLGLGVRPPTPSLGNMIAEGRDLTTLAWWLPVVPGIALVATVLVCNLLGDALRDRLDPHLVAD